MSAPRRRAPRPLTETLDHLRSGWAPPTLLAAVQEVWTGVVGEALAREAQPRAERGGVLTVACSSSLWAHELDLMGPVLVERLNVALGGDAVQRLRCTALGSDRAP
jgi:predicted nucleic acid-binding Zn ribbon protein